MIQGLCRNLRLLNMEKEIWKIVKGLDSGKLTVIQAHTNLCNLYNIIGTTLLNQCLNEQEEIISNPVRFNGVHINKLKEVFLKNGIDSCDTDF